MTLLSYVLVGLFYSAFSIFLRAILPSDNCLSVSSAANVLENVYLVFLLGCLLLSLTVQIDWAETGFRMCSIIMGLFTILMIVCSVFYAIDATVQSVTVYFMLIFLASYITPLLLNFRNLKVADFLKGVVYSIFMSPTYVNIFTIYAISNIHDISWGSRPSVQSATAMKASAVREEKYKNFRANFLIIWVGANLAIGGVVTYLSRNGRVVILLIIGAFLAIVTAVKLFFSIIHATMSIWSMYQVKKHKQNKYGKSDFFEKLMNMEKEETRSKKFELLSHLHIFVRPISCLKF